MRFRTLALIACVASCIMSSGCALQYHSRFSPPIKQDTRVVLKENDFEVAQTGLVGEASVWKLFGIIPLGDERLYSRAMADLYRKAAEGVEGTPAQLMYWTADETHTWALLLGRQKVVFRADLVRFTK